MGRGAGVGAGLGVLPVAVLSPGGALFCPALLGRRRTGAGGDGGAVPRRQRSPPVLRGGGGAARVAVSCRSRLCPFQPQGPIARWPAPCRKRWVGFPPPPRTGARQRIRLMAGSELAPKTPRPGWPWLSALAWCGRLARCCWLMVQGEAAGV